MKNNMMILALVAIAGSVHAAESVTDVLGKVSAAQADKVRAVVAQQQRGLGCKDYKVTGLVGVSSMRVPKNETGADAWWTARYDGIACAHTVVSNVEFDMRSGPLKLAPLAPGDTRADPILQGDVKKSFALAVSGAKKECKDALKVRNTTLVEQPKKDGALWREVWVATACGRDYGQIVTFLPNDKGIGFTMALAEGASKTTVVKGK